MRKALWNGHKVRTWGPLPPSLLWDDVPLINSGLTSPTHKEKEGEERKEITSPGQTRPVLFMLPVNSPQVGVHPLPLVMSLSNYENVMFRACHLRSHTPVLVSIFRSDSFLVECYGWHGSWRTLVYDHSSSFLGGWHGQIRCSFTCYLTQQQGLSSCLTHFTHSRSIGIAVLEGLVLVCQRLIQAQQVSAYKYSVVPKMPVGISMLSKQLA